MTRARLLTALLVLCSPAFATTALAQDQPADATQAASPQGGGDMGGADTESATPPPQPADQPAPPPPAESSSSASSAKPVSLSLLLGYGISLKSGPNIWGLGFGARGGYNIDKIYIGARFVYYLGKSQDIPGLGSVSYNVWELGVEGGYDLGVADKLTVRPMLGLGLADFGYSAKITGIPGGVTGAPIASNGSSSSGYLFVAPGVAALYDVSDSFFLGVDMRLQLVFSSGSMTEALIFLANGGMRF
ncbi:MAG: hypothetical protein ACHQ53_06785 [Polyangiales bacterium]